MLRIRGASFFAIFCSCVTIASSSRILFMTSCIRSHVRYMTSLAEALAEAGHEVGFIMSSAQPEAEVNYLHSKGVDIYRFKSSLGPKTLGKSNSTLLTTHAMTQNTTASHLILDYHLQQEKQHVFDMMDDKDLMPVLKARKFDLVISFNGYIIPYTLGVPYVTVSTYFQPWVERIPALPSFVPFPLLSDYTEKMTFFQRLHNTYLFAIMSLKMARPDKVVDITWKKYLPGVTPPTPQELRGKAALTFYNTDHIISYPVPSMPNVIYTGGLTAKPGKPLAPEYTTILDNAKEWVVLAATGMVISVLNSLGENKLIDAFGMLKVPVIFKYSDYNKPIPDNVKIFKELPQNDLLAHPKVKVFVTHCGHNSQMEALYHGVPMVCIPLFGDQPFNSARAQYKGYAIRFNIGKGSSKELAAAINEIWNNATYSDTIQIASRIFRDSPQTPCQKAVYWIEHVIKFGSRHLRSYALEMPLYQYWMLDILALLLSVLIVAVLISIGVIVCLVRMVKKALKPGPKTKSD